MSPRTMLIVALLTAIALWTWYLSRPEHGQTAIDETPEQGQRGYYLKEARILGTGGDGSLLYEIQAQHAEQQHDKSIEFTAVQIRYSPEAAVPWTVNADMATLRELNPRIELSGQVSVRANTGEDNETEIQTDYLELNPDEFIAETDERVQIRFGSRSLTATGMLASLKDDRIELKSNVRGQIVP